MFYSTWIGVILLGSICYGYPSYVGIDNLIQVNRFSNSSCIDYYFSCNTFGPMIKWGLNEQTLAGFSLDEVGKTVRSMEQNFDYTATLLSSLRIPGQTHAMLTSILIVSFEKNDSKNFNVTCSNGLIINHTSTTTNPVYVENFDNIQTMGDIIALKHVLSGKLIHNSSSLTHILSCSTADRSLTWGINREGIFFHPNDRIGSYITDTLDGITVFKQAILIARQPHETTSIIFITSDSKINVTCYFSPHPPAIFFSLEKSSDLFSNTTSEALQTTTLDETKTSEFVASGMLYKKVDKVKTIMPPKK